MSNLVKIVLIIILALVVTFLVTGAAIYFYISDAMNVSTIETGSLTNATDEPSQSGPDIKDPIVISLGSDRFMITPKASYNISARVVSKKYYNDQWAGKVAPVDFALAWGKLAETEASKHMKYSQKNRWYYFNYTANCPFSRTYIYEHSANNHMIPANENVRTGFDSVKAGDLVTLKGYLVYIDGFYNGKKVYWHSSLSRNDTGDGSCELFYVKAITLNGKVYN